MTGLSGVGGAAVMCGVECLEFRERNAIVAQKWAALSEDNRKEWAVKAEAVCSAAIQVGVVSGYPS